MVKFKGKHEGKIRGRYICKAFKVEHENKADNKNFSDDLNIFLERRGYQLRYSESKSADTFSSKIKRSYINTFYHVAGASVAVSQGDWDKTYYRQLGHKDSPHQTQMKLVSNDGLDEIVEKILDKFPSFKEIDFIKAY